jgi:hypothetical protein
MPTQGAIGSAKDVGILVVGLTAREAVRELDVERRRETRRLDWLLR